MYYRGAQAAIIVYDVTSTDTFARAKVWVKELQVRLSLSLSLPDFARVWWWNRQKTRHMRC